VETGLILIRFILVVNLNSFKTVSLFQHLFILLPSHLQVRLLCAYGGLILITNVSNYPSWCVPRTFTKHINLYLPPRLLVLVITNLFFILDTTFFYPNIPPRRDHEPQRTQMRAYYHGGGGRCSTTISHSDLKGKTRDAFASRALVCFFSSSNLLYFTNAYLQVRV
jgi:hypothetical protein